MTAPFSPRTPEEPMAFTNDELLRGATAAWVIFVALLLLISTIAVGGFMALPGATSNPLTWLQAVLMFDGFVLLFGGGISAVVMAFGAALMKALGASLRRVRSLRIHAVAYTAVGILISAVCVAPFLWSPPFQTLGWFMTLPALAAPFAVPLGWWYTVRLALLEDRGLRLPRSRRRADADAAAEDAALDG